MNPFENRIRREHRTGDYAHEELALAMRNHAMPMEALRYPVTPVGMHYLLTHFDIPDADEVSWRLEIAGRVSRPLSLSLAELSALATVTRVVTLECAGNGRALTRPRYPTMPWIDGGVGTAEWSGVPLAALLERAGVLSDAVDVAFFGADRGYDGGVEHAYGRSLRLPAAMDESVMVVHAMNGAPLPPQHGFPLRLVVPGWFGMASVKWLARIEVLDRPFDGFQQASNYIYRAHADDPGVPVTTTKVRSLMLVPGVPDFYTRRRLVGAGRQRIIGRAWSGGGVGIARVELGVDGRWSDATLDPPDGRWAWRGWAHEWMATPGEHELACRATDETGAVQPLEPVWTTSGMGNNAVQRVPVSVPG